MSQIEFSGKLHGINPLKIIKDGDKVDIDSFFLILGIWYNDLKSVLFYVDRVNEYFKEETKEITEKGLGIKATVRMGEYGGMKVHIDRLICSTLFGLFEFIKKYESVIHSGEFEMDFYNKLNNDFKSVWKDIISISLKENKNNTESEIYKILESIRHNSAAHYYQSNDLLRKGFIDFFFKDPKNETNSLAFYSLEEDMNNTRFFYCDAATQRLITGEILKRMEGKEYSENLREIVININFTIMRLMKIYLKKVEQRPIKSY